MEVSLDLAPPEGPRVRGWAGLPAAPRWVGVVPYEALRGQWERQGWCPHPDLRAAPLVTRCRWQRYDAVARVDHESGIVVLEADDQGAADGLERALRQGWRRPSGADPREASVDLRPLPDDEAPSAHEIRVSKVLELIARGDVYQVNVARRLRFAVTGDPLGLFRRLQARTRAAFGFFAELGDIVVCGSSPELALEVRGDDLFTAPIKGTRPRGDDAATDAAQAVALEVDPKERAELTMAVDLHRNDLGAVSAVGSVRVPRSPAVHGGPTVFSRGALVCARRREGITLSDLFRSVFPCGSVTGAPKVRAMEVIAALEPHRRGLYTGVCGYVGRDGGVTLSMAIRVLQIAPSAGGEAHYFTGGGIVVGSDPHRELLETDWKAAQLRELTHDEGALRPRAATKLAEVTDFL